MDSEEEPCYVLDANVFIEAARRYYAFDLLPSFWEALIQQAERGRVKSIDRVKEELTRNDNDDKLAGWANRSFHAWFVSTDESDVIAAYGRIMQWAYETPQFSEAAKREFAQGDNADAWLVAYALAKKCVLVTHEVLDPYIKRKIPIPNVCQAFGLRWIDTFQMLRELEIKLG